MTASGEDFSPFSDEDLAGPRKRTGVLVVDDDAAVRTFLAEELPGLGFAVWFAETGSEAVRLFRRHRDAVYLVLIDSRLLDWDGLDTLSELRRLDPTVRCCFMASFLDHQGAVQLFEQGAVGILTKPIRSDGLATALRLLTLGRGSRQLLGWA
jgi:two-component system response regulator HydG